ncbi:ATP/GTP-binding protein [Streptomyces sodiiphilus]|uniref:ATP/GTP-binding protein n=1 Tax=Streptomyces sodiiphilus TaxID=226217 RepID=A0ABP5B1N3_9ACTN
MDSSPSETTRPAHLDPDLRQDLVKIVICGGLGTGKTTLIASVSEIAPAHTEETMTEAGRPTDDLAHLPEKSTTTVMMDFGRRTLSDDLVLYLFGTGGQKRFASLWRDVAAGALGALVLVDTRRLDVSFDALDLAETTGLPYIVAVNEFPDSPQVSEAVLRDHLDLAGDTPVVRCRALDPASVLEALIELLQHAMTHQQKVAA